MSRILIIDDDDLLRGMLATALAQMGHVVTATINGRNGLAMQARAPSDLIITDVIMPEMDGLETIRELRRLQPTLRIIAMSGGSRLLAMDYLPIAMHLGAVRVLAKPFALETLAALVTAVLAGE